MSTEFEHIVIPSATAPKTEVAAGIGTTMQMLIPPDSAPNFAMRCFTIAPGGGMPNHTNEVEHEQYVLEGAAKVTIGEETFTVMTGDVVFIPAGVPHSYTNAGDSDFRFLCLVPNKPDIITLVSEC
jgi:quercetin dioxygenase-like cupin family protein